MSESAIPEDELNRIYLRAVAYGDTHFTDPREKALVIIVHETAQLYWAEKYYQLLNTINKNETETT